MTKPKRTPDQDHTGGTNETDSGYTVSDNAPTYYRIPTGGAAFIEPWEISYLLGHGFAIGAALKYLLRAGRKDGASEEQDLIKAIRSIERRLAEIKRERQAKVAEAGKSFHAAIDDHLERREKLARALKPALKKKGPTR